MIKFKQGSIGTYEGVKKDIIVTAALPNKVRNLLIGSAFIVVGVGYLTVTAFKNGSEHYEKAEIKVLEELGLLYESLK